MLALIALATPFVTQSLARRAVEVRIAALQPRVAQVEALRRRIAAGTAGNDVIAAEHAGTGDALQVLATVTELLPDDTVLADLTLRQGKLSISGRSRAAPLLIPAMAGDPTLHNPSFAAPVTRTPDGKADTFVIRAELVPEMEGALPEGLRGRLLALALTVTILAALWVGCVQPLHRLACCACRRTDAAPGAVAADDRAGR